MSVNLPQLDLNCWYNVFSFLDAKENNKITITCKGFENTIATLFQNNIKTMILKSELSFGSVVNLTKKYGKNLTELDLEERTRVDIDRLKELTICDQVKEINIASYKGIDDITDFEQIIEILKDFRKVETLTLNDNCESFLLKELYDENQISKTLTDSCHKLLENNLKGRKLKIKFGPYEIDTSNKKENNYSYIPQFPETIRDLRIIFDCVPGHDESKYFKSEIYQNNKMLSLEFREKGFNLFQNKFLKELMDDLIKNMCSLNKLKTLHLNFHYYSPPDEPKKELPEFLSKMQPLTSTKYLKNECCSELKELSKKIPTLNITLSYSYYIKVAFLVPPELNKETIYTGNYEDNKNKYIKKSKEKSIRQ